MTTVLPGATIGLLGGGENSRMFALAARGMGYRVTVYSPDRDDVARPVCDAGMQRELDDLISVREFAAGVDVLTVTDATVPALAFQAAADANPTRPLPDVFEASAGLRAETPGNPIAEFGIIGARGGDGECVFYQPIAVDRVGGVIDGVIDIARSPAAIRARVRMRAVDAAWEILNKLKLVGVACVEFALTPEHEVVVTAVIPTPHMSGYLTIDACVTGQFEQHVRAVCGLPLGSTAMLKPAATVMLGNADWENGEPDWIAALAMPGIRLHLYGKSENRTGRPRGHITAMATSATLAKQIVKAAKLSLKAANRPGARPAEPQLPDNGQPEAPALGILPESTTQPVE